MLSEHDQIKLSAKRFSCNWVWPFVFLFMFMQAMFRVYASKYTWLDLGLDAAWSALGVHWWREDLTILRELRAKDRGMAQ